MPTMDETMFRRAQFTGDATRINFAAGTQSTATQLTPGVYLLLADGECRWKQGASDITITSTTGQRLPPDMVFGPVYIDVTARSYIRVWGIDTGVLECIPVVEN